MPCSRFKAGTVKPVDPRTPPKRRLDLRKAAIDLDLLRKVNAINPQGLPRT